MNKKIILIALLLSFVSSADAEQVVLDTVYGVNSEVNHNNLNANFNAPTNVLNGGLDNTNTASGFNFVEVVSALPVAGDEGRSVFLTTNNTLSFDTGSSWVEAITVAASADQGDVAYYDGSNWARLAAGTAGNTLKSGGAAANPSWAALNLAGGSDYVTGDLPMADGGTGASLTNDPGGVPYCGTTTLEILADGTAGKFLQSQGTSAPAWEKVDLAAATDITGTLATGNGGTGATATVNTANGVVVLDGSGDLPATCVNSAAIDANAVNSTHISTSFMGCFSKRITEQTNTTLIAGTFTNKWIIYQGYIYAQDSGDRIPGGGSDEASLGEHWRTAGEDAAPVHSQSGTAIVDCKSDLLSVFSGRFYSESGIAAPAGTDAYSAAAAEGLCAESTDAANEISTDCFLYVDSTSADVMFHLGTLANVTTAAVSIFITVLPDTAL